MSNKRVDFSSAYDIPCLTEQWILAQESDTVTAFTVTEAVYGALLQSVITRQFKDGIVFFFSWIMWRLLPFFAILANFFSEFGHDQEKKLKM